MALGLGPSEDVFPMGVPGGQLRAAMRTYSVCADREGRLPPELAALPPSAGPLRTVRAISGAAAAEALHLLKGAGIETAGDDRYLGGRSPSSVSHGSSGGLQFLDRNVLVPRPLTAPGRLEGLGGDRARGRPAATDRRPAGAGGVARGLAT